MDAPLPATLTEAQPQAKPTAMADVMMRAAPAWIRADAPTDTNAAEFQALREDIAALHAKLDAETNAREAAERRITALEKRFLPFIERLEADASASTAPPAPAIPVVVRHDSGGFKYNFKWKNETLYAIATACALIALQSVADIGAIHDWKAWGIALIGACVRAAIAILQPKAPAELSVPLATLPENVPIHVEGAARPVMRGQRPPA